MRTAAKLLLLVLSTSLALAGGELVLRVTGRFPPQPRAQIGEHENAVRENFVADPDVGWKMRPHHVFHWETEGASIAYAADAHGLRHDPAASAAAGPQPTILLLGDSFFWGFGVPMPETLAGRLGAPDPSGGHAGFRVVNAALPGFGVDQMWRSLVHWGLPRGPDAVVVGLYTGDFERSFHAHREKEGFNKPVFRLADGVLVPRTRADAPPAWLRALEARLHLFGLARRTEAWLGRRHGVGGWWSLNAALLDAIAEACARAGAPVLFVHIPFKHGVGFPALRAFFAERDLGFVDLGDRPEPERRALYFETDGHLNAAGHQLLHETVSAWLEARGLAGGAQGAYPLRR